MSLFDGKEIEESKSSKITDYIVGITLKTFGITILLPFILIIIFWLGPYLLGGLVGIIIAVLIFIGTESIVSVIPKVKNYPRITRFLVLLSVGIGIVAFRLALKSILIFYTVPATEIIFGYAMQYIPYIPYVFIISLLFVSLYEYLTSKKAEQ